LQLDSIRYFIRVACSEGHEDLPEERNHRHVGRLELNRDEAEAKEIAGGPDGAVNDPRC